MEFERWELVFKDFQQIKRVNFVRDDGHFELVLVGQDITYQVTVSEMNELLETFSGNPHEVVTYILKKNGVLTFYQNTLVAFFDINAYSEFIKRTNIEEAINKVSNLMSNIQHEGRTDILAAKFDTWVLSDSIIFVIDTNRHPLFAGSIKWFLAACSMIMRESMSSGFPLRGAVGGGNFYKDGEILVSSGLIDAVNYEKKQNWLAAMLTPGALDCIEKAKELELRLKGQTDIDLLTGEYKNYVRYGNIPWKDKDSEPCDTYYLKPFMNEQEWTRYLPSYFRIDAKIQNSHCLYAEE